MDTLTFLGLFFLMCVLVVLLVCLWLLLVRFLVWCTRNPHTPRVSGAVMDPALESGRLAAGPDVIY